jgi:hypothetical protein
MWEVLLELAGSFPKPKLANNQAQGLIRYDMYHVLTDLHDHKILENLNRYTPQIAYG